MATEGGGEGGHTHLPLVTTRRGCSGPDVFSRVSFNELFPALCSFYIKFIVQQRAPASPSFCRLQVSVVASNAGAVTMLMTAAWWISGRVESFLAMT